MILTIDEDLIVILRCLDAGMMILAPIGRLPEEHAVPVLRLIAEANYLGQETLGGAIGVDSKSEEIALRCRLDEPRLGAADLAAALDDFVSLALEWRARLAAVAITGTVTENSDSTEKSGHDSSHSIHVGLMRV